MNVDTAAGVDVVFSADVYVAGRGQLRAGLISSHRPISMSLEDRIKATAKDAEGRLQAAAGAITGDQRLQAEGEAKQVQAHVMDAAGTIKDKVQQAAASVGEAIDGLTGHRN